jgi:nitroimidazol reductase NimA-like FMN-containing flavoprotein (pyridoxamine 5'-phosphate oxidase superfamily)
MALSLHRQRQNSSSKAGFSLKWLCRIYLRSSDQFCLSVICCFKIIFDAVVSIREYSREELVVEDMKNVIRMEEMCVLATAADDVPHCSLMAYIAAEDCSKIYMITHKNTKKYRNLDINPLVSLLIDTRSSFSAKPRSGIKALTINGSGTTVRDKDVAAGLRQQFVERHGHLSDFAGHDDAVVIEVTVRSLQLLRGATDASYGKIE